MSEKTKQIVDLLTECGSELINLQFNFNTTHRFVSHEITTIGISSRSCDSRNTEYRMPLINPMKSGLVQFPRVFE